MTRPVLVLGAVLLGASALAACDLVSLPEEAPELATYYVSSNKLASRVNGAGATVSGLRYSTVLAISYMSPDGMKTDTLRGAQASWSRVFERTTLSEFKMEVKNLSAARPDTADAGFAGATLLLNGAVIAHDSSRVVASVNAATPTREDVR